MSLAQSTDDKFVQPLLLAYVDEVKPDKEFRFYLLGAIVADANLVWSLEQKLNALSEKTFSTSLLLAETEFHASHIWNGRSHFKGWEFNRRIEVLLELIQIFGGVAKELDKILVTIDLEKIKSKSVDYEQYAMMFLIEKLDQYLANRNMPGLLIGDRENDKLAGKNVESLSRYRTSGTDLYFGRSIKRLLDTAHFTHSHQSRMLQLADLHTWLHQFLMKGDHGKSGRRIIIDRVKTIDGCMSLAKYKDWPTVHTWFG